ncbi:MAG: insulinase family protein [Nitrospirae bacterium]|nr:insulinase family protein [Nitrospirota bacterium]
MAVRTWTVLLAGLITLHLPAGVWAGITPTRFVSSNGITVLVVEQPALPIVQIQATIKAGAAQDPADKAGVANLVANLLDEGSTTLTATQIAEQIEFVGGTLATRAETDYSSASVRVLKKDLDRGAELLANILLQPTFPDREVERVRKQILGQILSEQDEPETIASKAFHGLVFDGHPYRWPVAGTETTLPTITREDLVGFYRRAYLPNHTILTIVGDITIDAAKALVRRHFGGWPQGAITAPQAGAPTPVTKTTSRLIDKDITQTTIMLGHLGINRANPDFYAVTVMNYILGAGGFSSRLMDSVRDTQGLAYGIHSAYEANILPGAFLVSLQTRNATAGQALTSVLTELKKMREGPVTDQELAEATAYLIGSFPLRFDTTAKLADVLSLVELHGLSLNYFSDYPKWISQVTKEDVLRVARQYLHTDHYALVVVGKLSEAKITAP